MASYPQETLPKGDGAPAYLQAPVPALGSAPVAGAGNDNIDIEKSVAANQAVDEMPHDDLKADSDADSANFQGGVRRVRAITTVWSKKTLWLMFALLYLVSFVDQLTVSITYALNPYITSSFGKHGLLATVGIVSSIVGACTSLTLAKVIDIWGRIEGFISMTVIIVIGTIMKATCQNMEAYVAAQTLWWVGHLGALFTIDVMLADMTSLRNRMIMFTVNGTPLICSTFAGPKIADLFYKYHNFRWAFGTFAILTVAVALPVVIVMLWEQRKAEKSGVLPKVESNRTFFQSVKHYLIEFDAVGIILVTAVFALILLPFNIVPYAPNGWKTGYIIAMEVLGVLCTPGFYVWEMYFAPVKFLPWKYLKEPTIIGSSLLYCVMFISIFSWNTYFGSYLQVVHRLDITTANYVLNAFSLASAIFSPVFGLLIRYTGNFKWVAYTGLPMMLLGTALLIPFRQPSTSVAVLTITQVLCGLGTGMFATCGQIAVMAVVTHQELAVVIAIWGMFGGIGSSIGFAISGAIWNNELPAQLLKRLPASAIDDAGLIFGDMVLQMSYADGTPERDAIVDSYAYVQRHMVIAGAALAPLCLIAIYLWKNVNVNKLEKEQGNQTKGNVW
ncbi:siderophore iron transporter mirB [Verticillium dahliae VdLs.17]|uniref:Siderophore iron transporter mirB n=1 Tax=Verticillium dahliae (strain VdLs.17 / ATCC MYA-4575 / FGSC 10137) TaxID=498257 RepID=G2WZL3_VERDV|nr:siderophore iron transporter mirB [Verticillium dahliae VdLs.17]EGY22015.1 siderophore iron transporter mirB [Verticillium dahliae VdLs.17]